MKKIILSSERFFSDYGDIKSYFLFSFADYFDPNNTHFGDLRVFNDDCIKSGAGFPMHPHQNFEIMTIMRKGIITHKDSLGNKEKIHAGEIQVTNTSGGVFHSEFNEDKEDIELYQLWFTPKNLVTTPSYYTVKFDEKSFENSLVTLASGIEKTENTLISEISVKQGIFQSGKFLEIAFRKYLFVYVTSGKVQLESGEILEDRDQLRIWDEKKVKLKFLEDSQILVIESL